MADMLTRDEFVEQKGSVFELELSEDDSIKLELIEVDEVKEMGPYESFSVVFLAPKDCGLESQIYKLKHEKKGEIELFLSPFFQDEKGLKLESIFSVAAQA
ncbi:MAG: hypothetical protein HKN25_17780 [Pyrinomonadaceae bacterium]|nr:hypothetical protein [Pyrinomonadaceae bacterium]